MLHSGSRLQELTRYGQGMANQEYGAWLNRLAALAGVGQTATSQTAGLGANAANAVGNAYLQGGQAQGNAYMQGGQAQAQGITGQANAILGGANAGLGLYGLINGGWGNVRQPAP